MAVRTVEINGDALKDAITARGYSLTEASEMLGFDKSYISRIAHNGEIKAPLVKTVEMLFRVEPESYVIMDEPEQMEIAEPQQTQEITIVPQISEEQWARLEKVIFNAVAQALFATTSTK